MSFVKTESSSEKRILTNKRILDASLDCFARKGFDGTSMREIASKAKLSLGLVYSYYESKLELRKAILMDSFEVLDAVVQSSNEQNDEDVLSKTISNFIELVKIREDRIRLLAMIGIQKDKLTELTTATFQKYQQNVLKIEDCLEIKGSANAKMESKILVAALDGLVLEYLLMGDLIDLETTKEFLIEKYK